MFNDELRHSIDFIIKTVDSENIIMVVLISQSAAIPQIFNFQYSLSQKQFQTIRLGQRARRSVNLKRSVHF